MNRISSKKSGRSYVRKLAANILDNFFISVIIIAVVFLFTLLPLSFSLFNTAQTMREQYSLMDAYFSIYNNIDSSHPGTRLSNDIVIVNIKDVYDRGELAGILSEVHSAHPKAIGLDVTFYEKKDSAADETISRIAASADVISPCVLLHETGTGSRKFTDRKTSFYMDSISRDNVGFVNIDLAGATMTCRHFVTEMYVGDTIVNNFAAAVAKSAFPEAYNELVKRGLDKEYINFDRTAFMSIDAAAVHENKDLLTDRIVLIGDKEDLADQYVTPMESRQPGVEIHAHAIDTIINGKFVNMMPEIWSWVLAFCVIFLFLPLAKLLGRNEWIAIFIPVIQTIIIFLTIFAGYCIFVSCHYYVRVIYAMIAIGFMEVGTGLYKKIKSITIKDKQR